MRVRSLKFLSIIAALVFLPLTARADTDYRCLNLCANSGKPASACMTQCTYQAPNAKTPVTAAQPTDDLMSKQRVLPTLRPIDDDKIAGNAPDKGPNRESKDYKCVNQCLQTHMQYQACSQQCTAITSADGTVIQPITFKSDETTGVDNTRAK